MLRDPFGRAITDLRISLTDRCNLRCVYCVPAEGIDRSPSSDLLSAEDITRVVKVAARHGVRRVRLTGGEPLVRRDLTEIIANHPAIPSIEEVSLDTLNPEKFRRITRGGLIEGVMQGIYAAENAGLTPVKINTVVVKGLNDDELPALARLSVNYPWHIGFIELMPVGNGQDWGPGFPIILNMPTYLIILNIYGLR